MSKSYCLSIIWVCNTKQSRILSRFNLDTATFSKHPNKAMISSLPRPLRFEENGILAFGLDHDARST